MPEEFLKIFILEVTLWAVILSNTFGWQHNMVLEAPIIISLMIH